VVLMFAWPAFVITAIGFEPDATSRARARRRAGRDPISRAGVRRGGSTGFLSRVSAALPEMSRTYVRDISTGVSPINSKGKRARAQRSCPAA
jgi:hypothetical protein